MAYFIIIRGPLGCGKSTIAKKLTKILNAEYISMDKILKENNLDVVDPVINCIPEKNFIRANEIILPKANKHLSRGRIVIFDGCFYHKKSVEHLIRNLPYQNYVFTLKAPVEVCIERNNKRKNKLGEKAARDVHKLASDFDYGIIIVSTKPLKIIIEEILSHLPKKRSGPDKPLMSLE